MIEAKSIKENLDVVHRRIQSACERVGRNPDEIQIMPVTKTVHPSRIKEVLKLGFTEIGENRIQEAERKVVELQDHDPQPTWHFIGHLQSNKVKNVVRFATMVQSIDRLKIARRLNKELKKKGETLDVLIQVNVSGEDSKYGINPGDATSFVKEVAQFERLNVKGLMTIGLFSNDWPKVRKGFKMLRELGDEINALKMENVSMEHLSMGMTNDFELAIEEGATMIRIGRVIFGERTTSDSFYWPGIKTDTN